MAASIALGIACAINIIGGKIFQGILFLLPVPLFMAVYFAFYAKRKNLRIDVILAVVCAFSFILGAGGAALQIRLFENANLDNHYYQITGNVKEKKDTSYGSVIVLKDLVLGGVRGGEKKYNLALYVYGNTPADVGDIIELNALVQDRSLHFEGKFSAAYLAERIKYTATVDGESIAVTGRSLSVFCRVNHFIRNSLKAGLSGNEFGVAYALLSGNSDFMGQEITENYRSAGVAHIFAVSGLHIGFFAVALGFIFKKLRLNKYLSAAAVVASCLFYSGVCGFSASSLRAVIMCAAVYATGLKGERYDGLSSMGIAAFIILMINPSQLFCAGFMLSFGAVIGIFVFSRPVSAALGFLPKKIADSLGAVVGAQLACIPISLVAFGHFSLLSIPANLIFLPVVGVIYVSLFVATLLTGITGASYCLLAHGYILKFVNMCISAIDYRAFLVGGMAFGGFTFFYYAACFCASGIINLKPKLKAVTAIVLCAVFLAGTVALNVTKAEQTRVYVIGEERLNALLVESKAADTLIVANCKGAFSVSALRRAVNDFNTQCIDDLVIMGNYDVQAVLSRVWAVCKVSRVWYYGDKDQTLEDVVKKSFPNTECLSTKEFANAACGQLKFYGEHVLAFTAGGKQCAVFGDYVRPPVENFETEICFAGEGATVLSALFNVQETYTFVYSPYYPNAAQGNLLVTP